MARVIQPYNANLQRYRIFRREGTMTNLVYTHVGAELAAGPKAALDKYLPAKLSQSAEYMVVPEAGSFFTVALTSLHVSGSDVPLPR